MAGANLTWTVMALAAFLACIWLVSDLVTNFSNTNGITVDGQYMTAYKNISSQTSELDSFNSGLEKDNWNTVTQVKQVFSSVLNSFMIGFGAITSFLVFPIILKNIFSIINSTIGIPAALSWFITFVIVFYIAMKVLKGSRGTLEEV